MGCGEKLRVTVIPASLPVPSALANNPAVEFETITGSVPVPLPPLVDVDIVNVGADIGAFLATVMSDSTKLTPWKVV